jgi:hypothetical protein
VDTIIVRPKRWVVLTFDALGLVIIGVTVAIMATGGPLVGPILFDVVAFMGLVGVNRLRLEADGQLVSCGGFRTFRWASSDIKTFVLFRQPVGGGWVQAVLSDGTARTLTATQVVLGRREAEQTRDRLNAWLAATGQRRDDPPPS